MNFSNHYIVINKSEYDLDYCDINIINFNQKFIISYFINNFFMLSEIKNEINYFDYFEYNENNKKISIKSNHWCNNYGGYPVYDYYLIDMYPISLKQFFLIKKNKPEDLHFYSIKKYLLQNGLEELII